MDVLVPTKSLQQVQLYLTSRHIKYYVMMDDFKSGVTSQERSARMTSQLRSLSEFNHSRYHPADEIEEWMNVASELDYVTKVQVGVTYEGRPISALHISRGGDNPTIYVDSLIHSREWISSAANMFVFTQILLNSSYSWMLDDLDWFFIPMINIDGYIHTWSDDANRLWRKTRSGGNSRCIGADGNRNWDIEWEGESSTPEQCSSLYHGTHAESEPEVRHIARFIAANNRSIKAVISVHSFAQAIFFPYSYALGKYPSNYEEQNATARAMSEAMFKVHGMEYSYGAGAEVLYESSGVTADWCQAVAGIDINLTVELRDTGQFGFLLPPEQIVPTGEEFLAGVAELARRVKGKYP